MTKEELLKKHKRARFEFVNFYKNTFIYEQVGGNIKVSFTAEYRDSLDKIEYIEELATYDYFYIY